jgi:hypothetical protein
MPLLKYCIWWNRNEVCLEKIIILLSEFNYTLQGGTETYNSTVRSNLLLPNSCFWCSIFCYIMSAHSLMSLNRTYLTLVLENCYKDNAAILEFPQKSLCQSHSVFDTSPVHLDWKHVCYQNQQAYSPLQIELTQVIADDESVFICMLMPLQKVYTHMLQFFLKQNKLKKNFYHPSSPLMLKSLVNFRIGPDSSNRKYLHLL